MGRGELRLEKSTQHPAPSNPAESNFAGSWLVTYRLTNDDWGLHPFRVSQIYDLLSTGFSESITQSIGQADQSIPYRSITNLTNNEDCIM